MPIVAGDLNNYQAADMPVNDTDPYGGTIDLLGLLEFTQPAADDTLNVVSDNAGDTTQTLTITFRTPAGAIDTEVYSLNGTNSQTGAKTMKANGVLSMVLSAAAAGIVTVTRQTGGATVKAIPAGKTSVAALIQQAASDPGQAETFHGKQFLRNDHGTLALTAAKVELSADPEAIIKIALASAKDDVVQKANRKTAPSAGEIVGGAFSDDAVSIAVPTDQLAAGERIGCYAEMSLTTGHAAVSNTFTVELSGTTV